MRLCKHQGAKSFDIWNPRWHDKRVLMAVHKVSDHNRVVFSKSKALKGEFYISGKIVKRYKKENNGKIECFSVPLDKFEPLEIKAHCEHELY